MSCILLLPHDFDGPLFSRLVFLSTNIYRKKREITQQITEKNEFRIKMQKKPQMQRRCKWLMQNTNETDNKHTEIGEKSKTSR